MKLRKKYGERVLAGILITSLCFSVVTIPGVFAEKNTEVQETSETNINIATGSDAAETKNAEEIQVDKNRNETLTANKEIENISKLENKENLTDNMEAESPFLVTVKFDGKKLWGENERKLLSEAEENDEQGDSEKENRFEDPWISGNAKTVQIEIKRNSKVDTDSEKSYFASLSVSDVFYFNQIPELKNTNGIKNIKMIQNSTPLVENSMGEEEKLKSFNPYSGEILLELDPDAKKIEIPELKIHYNTQLSGYTGGEQEIEEPFKVTVFDMDRDDAETLIGEDYVSDPTQEQNPDEILEENLRIETLSENETGIDEMLAAEMFEIYRVDSVILQTSALKESSPKSKIAVNHEWRDYKESQEPEDDEQVEIKKNDTLSYAFGLKNQFTQVYQTLTVEFKCPYITVDGVDYYLKFSTEDEAILYNCKGDKKGYSMAESASVDEESHTITYSFQNIILGSGDILFYTPEFSWPELLENMEIPEDAGYNVNGCDWEIENQTGYMGTETTLSVADFDNPVYYTGDAALAEEQPYQVTVNYNGTNLQQETNEFSEAWASGKTREITIKIDRNNAVSLGEDKNYLLSVKVPTLFYFTGLPDISNITGAEQITLIQNPTPTVNLSNGSTGDLPNFSQYSGEIRILLNPTASTITIPELAVGYNPAIAGFTGGNLTITDSMQITLEAVSKGESWEGTECNFEELVKYNVDSVILRTGSNSGAVRSSISIDKFVTNGVHEQNMTLGKSGTVAYGGGTAGQAYQIYKRLKVEFHCPYITVDGSDYYLSFDRNDTAMTSNKQGKWQGFSLSGNVLYDAQNHTLTYEFSNIYIGSHTTLFYTPLFSWPTELADKTIAQSEQYEIKGCDWYVKEQVSYTDAATTLKDSYTPSYKAYYISEGVNIQMTSSAEAPSEKKIAKRKIYRGLTRANGNTGALGFFDIHNDGTLDSQEVKCTFSFNTDGSDAKYYVTQVNLPVYGNTTGTKVTYVLTNGETDVEGEYQYANSSSYACKVGDLRNKSTVDSTYYIKSLSYVTKLEKGKKYHLETAHLFRNRTDDSGLYFGYIEGETGRVAKATLQIESVNGDMITEDGKTSIVSTETSTVADNDYIGYSLTAMQINNALSTSIVAGNSATLRFGINVSGEEHSYNDNTVNGYHVFRDGIAYVCLPVGVSIMGIEQVKMTIGSGSRTADITEVKRLDNTKCTIDNNDAYWWKISAENINAVPNQSAILEIQLATDRSMSGLTWNFQNCVALRTKEQAISWGAAGQNNTVYNTLSDLGNSRVSSVQALYMGLQGSETASDPLGLSLYSRNSDVKMTIARAEAKLDVAIGLKNSDETKFSTSTAISDENTELDYQVTISSTDGGGAKNFRYYIPIVSGSSVIDTSAMVTDKDLELSLQKSAEIRNESSGITTKAAGPFVVEYTTAEGLTAASIQTDNVEWKSEGEVTDFSKITAVRISTSEDGEIGNNEKYSFTLKLKYAGTDIDQMAGCYAGWRSFGRYTYVRNGAETTNTYPNAGVKVVAQCEKDMRENAISLSLNTGNTENSVSSTDTLSLKFQKAQTLQIKKVAVSDGTILEKDDPKNLVGADANSKFKMQFQINSGASTILSNTKPSASWTISANDAIIINIQTWFSKALTDTATDRYVDVTFGNENINIIYRMQLIRKVAPADATASVITEGEVFQVPGATAQNVSITQNSDFTALYVVKDFIPGNYTDRKLCWTDNNGQKSIFPENTAITMMEVSEESKITGYWYFKVTSNVSEVDLNNFRRMGGLETDKYQYETSGAENKTLRYLFVVNFENTKSDLSKGEYRICLRAKQTAGVASAMETALGVSVKDKTGYHLIGNSSPSTSEPVSTITYTVNNRSGNDSYAEGKTMALVLEPVSNSAKLPEDARIKSENQEYFRNSLNQFVIPIGTIQNGTKELSLISEQFPDDKTSYEFTCSLYLSMSFVAMNPMNGVKVGSCNMKFEKTELKRPAFRVTGTQVSENSGWTTGQNITISMENIPDDANITVTAYSGLTGSEQITDLMSSVSGMFDIADGTGTYNRSNQSTGKLVLSSSARPGTYRLIFDVKDQDGATILSVPYYIIVKESQ